MIDVHNSAPRPSVREAVLFPFDNSAFPFTAGLRLHLVSATKQSAGREWVVVRRGKAGDPDDLYVRFYGVVIAIGDMLHMWYEAKGTLDPPYTWPDRPWSRHGPRRICYAVSEDGVTWEKPKLGLVEYNGNKDNNIVDIQGGECRIMEHVLIHDPEDPDPMRRFKMVFESEAYGGRMAVAYSPDGLRWHESPRNPVGPTQEMCGLIKYNGCYYLNGALGAHYGAPRQLCPFASYDFEEWTEASCLGYRRDPIPPRAMHTESNTGEEMHLGTGLWDRGNAIIGVMGLWHGHPTGDRHFVAVDLGLLVSNDALIYREPIPDFPLVPAKEETERVPEPHPMRLLCPRARPCATGGRRPCSGMDCGEVRV